MKRRLEKSVEPATKMRHIDDEQSRGIPQNTLTIENLRALSGRDKVNAFIQAAGNGRLEVVKNLMTFPSIDPTAFSNDALRQAAGNGHLEVVKYLLTLPRVDPTVLYNNPIRQAARNGHLEVVKWIAVSYYNPFDPSIDKTLKQERKNFLTSLEKDNDQFKGKLINHCLSQTPNKLIYFILNDSTSPLYKDINRHIVKVAIENELNARVC